MVWKLLTLQPLKPFFFGKESVFTNSFYAYSEYFPQQTQITGALRLYWMEQNGLMKLHKHGRFCTPDKKEKAIDLVGDAGSETFEKNDNLGRLHFISPIFIVKKEANCIIDAFFEIPSDIVKKDCSYQIAKPKILHEAVSSKPAILLENYSAKKGFYKALGGKTFWEEYKNYKTADSLIDYEKVFKPYDQVGIALDENKQTIEEQFYIKRSYNLHKNFELAVILKINEDGLKEEKKLKNGIITLGAENSLFKITVSNIPQTLQNHPVIKSLQDDTSKKGTKIVLLSDSMIDHSIQKDAYFQIIPNRVKFKMMSHKSNEKTDKLKPTTVKTKEKLLVPKGSIYYFNTPNKLPKAKGAYAKMGFNTYFILN